MDILRRDELVDVPWKNGGGTTRMIATARLDGALAWRLSRADVARDGAFSDFAGLMRILTVVDGGGMALEHPGGALRAEPWEPVRFDGGLAVFARLQDGPLTDLNLMFDPALCEGEVRVHRGPQAWRADAPERGERALHVLAGAPRVGGRILGVADTVFPDAPADLTLAEGDAVLDIVLRYLHRGTAAPCRVLGGQ